MGKELPCREPEAAWSAGPQLIRETKGWATPSWPLRTPEAVWLGAVPRKARPTSNASSGDAEKIAAETSAMMRLRVVLPDSHAAPSSARRDELWHKLSGGSDVAPVDELFGAFSIAMQRAGIVEPQQPDAPQPKRLLFLRAAIHSVADECGLVEEGRAFHRSRFRLLIQRVHQYLDAYAVLADQVFEPNSKVTYELFERLLAERRHEHALRTGGKPMTAVGLFDALSNAGESFVQFDRLARWSVRCQLVRPGSGALVPQKRWAAHMVDPSTAAIGGTYNSARCRPPSEERAPKASLGTSHGGARSPQREPRPRRVEPRPRPVQGAFRPAVPQRPASAAPRRATALDGHEDPDAVGHARRPNSARVGSGSRPASRPSSARSSAADVAGRDPVTLLEGRRQAHLSNHRASELRHWSPRCAKAAAAGEAAASGEAAVSGERRVGATPATEDADRPADAGAGKVHFAPAGSPRLGGSPRFQSETNRKVAEATRLGVPIPTGAPGPPSRRGLKLAAGTTLVSTSPRGERPPTEVHGGLRHRPRSAPYATSLAPFSMRHALQQQELEAYGLIVDPAVLVES